MIYQANDYRRLIGMEGFGDELLKNHFRLYEGYVKNANMLLDILRISRMEGKAGAPQFLEIKRRLSFELNGIHLHEYYFDNLSVLSSGEPDKTDAFYHKICDEFGSWTSWKEGFRNLAMMRGTGWVVMIYDPRCELLLNTWVDEHHIGNVAGTIPVLVLDLWEHAMLLDYGSDRKAYVEAFFNVVDWKVVAGRYLNAVDLVQMHVV